MIARRRFLALAALAGPALARDVDLSLPGGPSARPLIGDFPGKGSMILQRTTPPLLETPMAVFDGDILAE